MLTLIVLLPILGSLFFINIDEELNQNSKTIIKQIGLSTSLITFIFTLILFSQFNSNIGWFQYINNIAPFGSIGLDGLSIYYVLLTINLIFTFKLSLFLFNHNFYNFYLKSTYILECLFFVFSILIQFIFLIIRHILWYTLVVFFTLCYFFLITTFHLIIIFKIDIVIDYFIKILNKIVNYSNLNYIITKFIIIKEGINYFLKYSLNKIFTNKIIKNTFALFYSTDNYNQSNSNLFDSGRPNNNIDPWFITGISDGDSCFTFYLSERYNQNKSNANTVAWNVHISYTIIAGANASNLLMLQSINNYFDNVGKITLNQSNNCYSLTFLGLSKCLKIKAHFDKYPLLTYKLVHYILWCKVLDILSNKGHLTNEGLNEIVGLKFHLTRGLSNKLITAFPNYTNIESINYNPNLSLMNLNWLAGFINSDGNFHCSITASSKYKAGYFVQCRIKISQDDISLIVLNHIIEFLGMGKIVPSSSNRTVSNFTIQKLEDINKFISLFKTVKFHGVKSLDYNDFCLIIKYLNEKKHLSSEGVEEIKLIVAGMNSTRSKFE